MGANALFTRTLLFFSSNCFIRSVSVPCILQTLRTAASHNRKWLTLTEHISETPPILFHKKKKKRYTSNKKTQENLIVFILCLCWEVRIFVFSLGPSCYSQRELQTNQFYKWLFPEPCGLSLGQSKVIHTGSMTLRWQSKAVLIPNNLTFSLF